MISDHYQSPLVQLTRLHPGIYKIIKKWPPLNSEFDRNKLKTAGRSNHMPGHWHKLPQHVSKLYNLPFKILSHIEENYTQPHANKWNNAVQIFNLACLLIYNKNVEVGIRWVIFLLMQSEKVDYSAISMYRRFFAVKRQLLKGNTTLKLLPRICSLIKEIIRRFTRFV